MINKDKIEKLKKRIKHYTPEIIVVTTTVTAIAVIVITRQKKIPPFNEPMLDYGVPAVTNEVIARVRKEGVAHCVTDDGIYHLIYDPK